MNFCRPLRGDRGLVPYVTWWLRCGIVECGAAEDRCSHGMDCSRVRAAVSDVIDIG